MKYLGSKTRIAYNLIQAMSPYLRNKTIYYEPFVGGSNLIDKVPFNGVKFGADNHAYLIAMFQKLQQGWEPDIPRDFETYSKYRELSKRPLNLNIDIAHEIGYVGFIYSYGGGYYPHGYAKSSGSRNYQDEAHRNLMNQVPSLKDIEYTVSHYLDTPEFSENTLLYCDPPYNNTKGYGVTFDSDRFWAWADSRSETVIVSELHCPLDNWVSILELDIINSNSKDMRTMSECLFVRKDQVLIINSLF